MRKIAVGVDVGTSQTKAVGYSNDGQVQATAYITYPLIQEVDGMAEQQIEQVFQAVVTCLKQVVQQVAPLEISCIAFSTAMHGLIVMDQTNQPLTRLITWADNRAEKYAEALKDTALGQKIYQNTGIPMHPMSPFQKIRWLKAEYPTIYKRAAKFISMKEYIMFRFFNHYLVDISSASGTGFFNVHTLSWDNLTLKELGISETQLPRLVKPTHQLTGLTEEWAKTLGLSKTTIFVMGGADGPLSNLGLGAITKGTAVLTVGTSGAVRYIVDRPCIHPQARTFCFVLDENHWVIGGATSNGAGIFEWACKTFLKDIQHTTKAEEKNSYETLLPLIAEIPVGSHGVLFHPYLLGERAPLWDAEATGSFVGLRRQHDARILLRAVVEGICLNIKTIFKEIEGISYTIDELRTTGGFTHSQLLKKIMADVLDENLTFTKNSEASALGAVLIGWKSIGEITSLKEGCQYIDITEIIEPDKENSATYEQIYPLYHAIQQQLATSYHQLAKLRTDLDKTFLTKS